MADDRYTDGSYLQHNPTLHAEDSYFKFGYIKGLLESVTFDQRVVRILDVGGGAGTLAAEVCRYLAGRGHTVECHAYDLGAEMLDAQRRNNPFIVAATTDFDQVKAEGPYDLALLIDVIEHIPDHAAFSDSINQLARHVIYNIPTERNLFDWLRNLYFGGQYYSRQTASLGHVHFFSARQARRYVAAHHRLLKWMFADFGGYLLASSHPDYVQQRKNRLRLIELTVSRAIYRLVPGLAPMLIQGSLFMLAAGSVHA